MAAGLSPGAVDLLIWTQEIERRYCPSRIHNMLPMQLSIHIGCKRQEWKVYPQHGRDVGGWGCISNLATIFVRS